MDINYVPLERLLDKADNSIYKLVIIAANRAKEIAAGKPVLLETPKSDKPTTIALEEIAAGKVRYKDRGENQVTKEDVPTNSDGLKTYIPFMENGIVDANDKEDKISAGYQEIHPPPEDDY